MGRPFVMRYNALVDRAAEAIADWLGTRGAFVQITVGSILWIPFVVLGLDNHGFLYLYLATGLSLITQVPLAMIGLRAAKRAQAAEDKGTQLQESMLTMLKGVHALVEGLKHELAEQDEMLEDIHKNTRAIDKINNAECPDHMFYDPKTESFSTKPPS